MQQENDTRKLERRAKALLLNKNIPSSKMEIVRSLMKNTDIPAQERYNAIIELVKSCDDKPKEKEKNKETLLTEQRGIDRSAHTQENDIYAPIDSNYYINDIYKKYKNLKLFRKRYLIISNNKLGVGIKKRLIPSKRLMKAIREIVAFQEKILTRLPDILMEILKDESIDDATHFNYLRIFRRWMMETPIVKYSFEEVKWMDVPAFESEIQSYIINLFSFLKMNIELKEEILLQAESKLRNLND
ncbi:MAG: hypothetical protein SVR08_13890, partial [Spirochaetota bacterium]|nr:hypothetical protein [Spirochaetota bacterium]